MTSMFPNSNPGDSLDIREYLLGLNLTPDPLVANSVINEMGGIGLPGTINEGGVTEGESIDDGSTGYRSTRVGYNPYKPESPIDSIASIYSSPIGSIGNEGHVNQPYDEIDTNTNFLKTESDDSLTSIITKNQYISDGFETIDIGGIQPAPITQQVHGYLDTYQNLNIGGPSTDMLNIIGGVLNGNVITGPDVRNNIVGRGLTANGDIKETPLGEYAVEGLVNAFHANSMFGLQEQTLGKINLNPLDIIGGADVFEQNWAITVRPGKLGKVLDFFGRVNGTDLPRSLMTDSSFFYTPSLKDHQCNFPNEVNIFPSNTVISNLFIANTGKGQIKSLFSNLNLNCYAPAYKDSRLSDLTPNYYGAQINNAEGVIEIGSDRFSRPFITKEDYRDEIDSKKTRSDKEDDNGLFTNDVPEIDYLIWDANSVMTADPENLFKGNKSSILAKTQALFHEQNYNNIRQTLIIKEDQETTDPEISTSYEDFAGNPTNKTSRGSGLVNRDGELCRTWSSVRRYNQIHNLQKNSGFYPQKNSSTLREGLHQSVLGEDWDGNGHPKIGPYMNDDITGRIKRFMFSIENLAWGDYNIKLPPCELGPGDPLSGVRGRIMWFPPYDLNFTDNTSVNWEATPFIGRGEPVYTYNNTERTGTLSFKVIVDHPSQLNDLRWSADKNEIDTVMAGCERPKVQDIKNSSQLTPEEQDMFNVSDTGDLIKKNNNRSELKESLFVYFANDNADLVGDYEFSADTVDGRTRLANMSSDQRTYKDPKNFGLNKNLEDGLGELSDEMRKHKKGDGYVIKIYGRASDSGSADHNKVLGAARAKYVIDTYFSDLIADGYIVAGDVKNEGSSTAQGSVGADQASEAAKKDRNVEVKIEYMPVKVKFPDAGLTPDMDTIPNELVDGFSAREITTYRECDYFIKMRQDNKFVYDDIRQSLRWFHPAFHSTTPEGLNSRLTFLQQCTRQGPTHGYTIDNTGDNKNSGDINNLQFGRPPICILRIGDFYHTKIVIDSVNISYEPLVLDLNPEGIGVQPMIAVVDLSFKFIGGSSLGGPINKLQNALSFNFFANTEVYDKRADKIKIEKGVGSIKSGEYADYNNGKLVPEEVEGSQGGVSTNELSSRELSQLAEAKAEAESNQAKLEGGFPYVISVKNWHSGTQQRIIISMLNADGKLFGEGKHDVTIFDRTDPSKVYLKYTLNITDNTASSQVDTDGVDCYMVYDYKDSEINPYHTTKTIVVEGTGELPTEFGADNTVTGSIDVPVQNTIEVPYEWDLDNLFCRVNYVGKDDTGKYWGNVSNTSVKNN